jgi:hypothetical protein
MNRRGNKMSKVEKQMLEVRDLIVEAWGRALAVNVKELNLNQVLLHLDEASSSINEAIGSYAKARPV